MLADFMALLDPVNELADRAPGFVWRLQTEDGDATSIRAFEWDVRGTSGILVNMSVPGVVKTANTVTLAEIHLTEE